MFDRRLDLFIHFTWKNNVTFGSFKIFLTYLFKEERLLIYTKWCFRVFDLFLGESGHLEVAGPWKRQWQIGHVSACCFCLHLPPRLKCAGFLWQPEVQRSNTVGGKSLTLRMLPRTWESIRWGNWAATGCHGIKKRRRRYQMVLSRSHGQI